MNTAEQVLYLLKTRGAQTAQDLADLLELTSMGARKQLESWQEKGMVDSYDEAEKVGRPTRYWQLTAAGHARFPDRHGDLTVQIIQQVRSLFGEPGLERLIDAREQESEAQYRTTLAHAKDLPARLHALSAARNAEGYMAEVETRADGSFLLIENHCPICAATQVCQNFCRSELAIFQRVLGPDCSVERSEHLHAGARRCAYLIRAL
jgi:predicted ArsR family transcriptional regulator